MTNIISNFKPDPEIENRSLPWVTPKPIFKTAFVEFAPPYPDYRKRKVMRSSGVDTDPSSASAKIQSELMEVVAYSSSGNTNVQQSAWDFLIANVDAIESSLRRKLLAYHHKSLEEFLAEHLPESKAVQKYWTEIETQVSVRDASVIDRFHKLVQIGIADVGLDDNVGFTSYEFQTGWDHDHGLEIVMHKADILAAGGMGELMYGFENMVATVRSVQQYDYDEGDLRMQ